MKQTLQNTRHVNFISSKSKYFPRIFRIHGLLFKLLFYWLSLPRLCGITLLGIMSRLNNSQTFYVCVDLNIKFKHKV
jgi:hypothetical protein